VPPGEYVAVAETVGDGGPPVPCTVAVAVPPSELVVVWSPEGPLRGVLVPNVLPFEQQPVVIRVPDQEDGGIVAA
jgi:hypothetical protein